jgi:hypothetical protein
MQHARNKGKYTKTAGDEYERTRKFGKWEHTLTVDVTKVPSDCVDWIRLAQEGILWLNFANAVMNFDIRKMLVIS